MRKLKHHEQKLLKKVNFYDWKKDRNVKVADILRKFQIEDREDYTKYNKLRNLVDKCAAQLKKLKQDDPDRIKMTEILIDKLYSMGLLNKQQGLEDVLKLNASHFCTRRLPVVMVKLRFCENLKSAVKFVQQGHIRIGPDLCTNPALHVTRDMEDHITWAEGSKIKRHVKEFQDNADDFDLLGN
mmetsp:Transcript_27435/g.64076  ORF Transcript_27435/g.64076 Transcript_27435/m.64076 type:complete len:184 (+) Transcript_27435:77-628(+)